MHDDPPMSDELSARFYPRFEARWRAAEAVGRTLMLVAIVATLFGLLGGGPVYLWTRTVSDGGLSVTYQPVARFGTPSGLNVTIPVEAGAKEVAVTLPDAIAGGFDLQSVTPQPTRWEPGDGSMRLAFAPKPGAERMVVHLGGMPPSEGWLTLSVQLDGRPPLAWSQFVLP